MKDDIVLPEDFPSVDISPDGMKQLFTEILALLAERKVGRRVKIDPYIRREIEIKAATLCVVAIGSLEKTNDLQVRILTDELTQLLRQQHFQRAISESLWGDHLKRDPKRDCALLMIDLKDFKRWNGVLGYRRANVVLAKVATLIQEHVRSLDRDMDIQGRYGGDEYAVLVSNVRRKDIRNICDRFTDAIRNYAWRDVPELGDHGKEISIQVSIGVAFCKQAVVNAMRSTLSQEEFEVGVVHWLIDCASNVSTLAKKSQRPLYEQCRF